MILIQGKILKSESLFVSLFLVVLSFCSGSCTIPTKQEKYSILRDAGKSSGQNALEYDLLVYPNTKNKLPLFLIFHSSGSNGNEYIEMWRKEAIAHKVMLLAPTLKENFSRDSWHINAIYEILEKICREYPVDRNQLTVQGVSAGAFVAQWVALKQPEIWKNLVLFSSPPIDIKANGVISKNHFPSILIFHGEKDDQTTTEDITASVRELKKKNFEVRLVEDPDAGHEQNEDWPKYAFEMTHSAIK